MATAHEGRRVGAAELGIEKVELDDLFKRADFISLHTPLTEATRSIIDAKAIRKMKKSVRIINCARGDLIVEKDLKMALEKGDVAGAALTRWANQKLVAMWGRWRAACARGAATGARRACPVVTQPKSHAAAGGGCTLSLTSSP